MASLQAENLALERYRERLALVGDRSVALEEFARQMIQIEKMLRRSGEVATAAEREPGQP